MKKIILCLMIIFSISLIYSRENSMINEKMISITSKEKGNKKQFQSDSIAGIWQISSDKHYKTFNSKGWYLLIIYSDEISGKSIFFDEFKGNIIKEIDMKIKRIDIGTYEIKYLNSKRVFKIAYNEYFGMLYLYYEDSNKFIKNEIQLDYDGTLFSRDFSDDSVKKLIQIYVDESKMGDCDADGKCSD